MEFATLNVLRICGARKSLPLGFIEDIIAISRPVLKETLEPGHVIKLHTIQLGEELG